jgi:hypothetical protein
MRAAITLDDDVVALVDSVRARTGESFEATVNRLLRQGGQVGRPAVPPPLPQLRGRPLVDVSDISALIAPLDHDRGLQSDRR